MTQATVDGTASIKQAFAQFPSGVAAFSAMVGFAPEVLVASSFTVGVSLEPPLVMFAVQKFSTTWPKLLRGLRLGVSVLAARKALGGGGPFALLMGDHLFDVETLRRLCAHPRESGQVLLAIDRNLDDATKVAEATKVQTQDGLIVEIGKDLADFDALDTGIFVADGRLFAALDSAASTGDTTLSAGIRRLARERSVRGVDIAGAAWFDIDTRADLARAREAMTTSR